MHNHDGIDCYCSSGSCAVNEEENEKITSESDFKRILFSAITGVLAILVTMVYDTAPVLSFIVFFIPYLVVGWNVIKEAFSEILHGEFLDEAFLMTFASIGAFAIGKNTEALAVMLFYQIGEFFQERAVGKSRRNIEELMDLRPDYANVLKDGKVERTDPSEVPVGTVIVVNPGERIPLDGTVVKGESMIDTSSLTGESMPVSVEVSDPVSSGCINQSGVLEISTEKLLKESTATRILNLVNDSSAKKSRSEDFLKKFARIYTPVVTGLAVLLVLVPNIYALISGNPADWSKWFYRALSFLVVSCPCAIVISVPLSFFGGIGGASSDGILIKGSGYVETLSKVDCMVFDKTGTITRGDFFVTGVHHNVIETRKLLELAALAESGSDHPISRSIRKACGTEPDLSRVKDIREISGKGVSAVVDGKKVLVGNSRLMESEGIEFVPCNSIGTIVHIAVDGKYAGHIVISDRIKPYMAETIKELKKMGVKETVMLTGDRRNVAENVAKEIGIDIVEAELMPEDKVTGVEKLLEENRGKGSIVYVGDGINDAPVLARADAGIAMGGLGTDAAIEAADIVLMDDDPRKLSKAIGISRKCMRIVKINLIFAISVKILCLILGALGIGGLWVAIFADVGVLILCVLNAIRCLNTKNVEGGITDESDPRIG